MEFRLLGPLEARDGTTGLELGARKQRALLARLLLDAGRTVAVERLIDDLWGEDAPVTAAKMVQIYVSGLRKQLPAGTIVTRAPGYALELGEHAFDLHRFEALRDAGVRALQAGDAETASARLREALGLWRGRALAEFTTEPFAAVERPVIDELRLGCLEERIEADLVLGRHAEVIGELEALTLRHPLRERPRALAMIALYRARRQAEALGVYQAFRRTLDDELGIEPSPQLRELELRMLRQDPGLELVAPQPEPARAAPAPPSPTPAPVGREPELQALHACLDEALAGRRRVAFVTGEAGIGKTTLVEALLASAESLDGVLVARGQCIEHHGPSEAYRPLFDVVGGLARGPARELVARLLAERGPIWLAQMPWLAPPHELVALQARVANATPERMLREMVDVLEALAVEQPLVVALEDLHWSDYSTVDLVTTLARRQDPSRLLLVATYRPADAQAAGHPLDRVARELRLRRLALDLRLAPLSPGAVSAYLAARGAGDVDPDVAERLCARTRGNPLFVEQVVDEWLAAAPPADPTVLVERIPATLRDLVEQQVAGLAGAEQEVLAAASVAGRELTTAAVAAACERADDEVEVILEGLAARGALIEGAGQESWPDGTVTGRYRFLHDICPQILYDLLGPGRRARLHRRVGVRLERGHGERANELAAQLASHFDRGGDAAGAVRHLRRAAEQAFARLAPRDALEHVARGLEWLDGLSGAERDRAELALRRIEGPAMVFSRGWDDPEAERLHLRMRELCERLGEQEQLQWVLYKLATFYEIRGEYPVAERLLHETLALPVADGAQGILVDLNELMACSLFHQGSFDASLDYAERALRHYDGRYSNRLTIAYGENPGVAAHSWAALALWFLGFPDTARRRADAAIELARDPHRVHGMSAALAYGCMVAQLRREPAATRELAVATIDVARRQGFAYREAMGEMLHGWARALSGAPEDGLAELRRGRARAHQTGVRMDDLYHVALFAEACDAAGRTDEGLAALDRALQIAAPDRSGPSSSSGARARTVYIEPELHRLEGELLLRAGEADGATAAFRRALATARDRRSPPLELRAAVALAELRPDDGAARAEVAETLGRMTEGLDGPDARRAAALVRRSPERSVETR